MTKGSKGGWEKDPVLELLPKEWWYRRDEGQRARKSPKGARPDDIFHYEGKGHLSSPTFGELVILEYKPHPVKRRELFSGIGQSLFYHHKTGLPVYLVINEEDYKDSIRGPSLHTPLGVITYHKEPVIRWVEVVKYWGR